jgi:hypothetical protein
LAKIKNLAIIELGIDISFWGIEEIGENYG